MVGWTRIDGEVTNMHRYLKHHIQFVASVGSATKAWHYDLRTWIEARRNSMAAEKYADKMSVLDPHILYDIGLSDCRLPPHNSSVASLADQSPVAHGGYGAMQRAL